MYEWKILEWDVKPQTNKQTDFMMMALDMIIERLIIANQGLEFASFLSNPWFKDATFLAYIKNMHDPYKPIKFHPSKIFWRTRNWIATRIHNT